jgi:uncharacterized membrane protein YqaE (UPF0057 family)
MGREGSKDFWRVLIALFLPPLGVFMQVGLGLHFWLNLLLCLTVIGGQLHAVYVISTVGPNGREVPDGMQTFISLVVAAFLPPVGVLMKRGIGVPLLINLILCWFFVIPGSIHALWVITNDGPGRR